MPSPVSARANRGYTECNETAEPLPFPRGAIEPINESVLESRITSEGQPSPDLRSPQHRWKSHVHKLILPTLWCLGVTLVLSSALPIGYKFLHQLSEAPPPRHSTLQPTLLLPVSDLCNLAGLQKLGEGIWCHSLRDQPLACASSYLILPPNAYSDGVELALCEYNQTAHECVSSSVFSCTGTPPAPPAEPPSPVRETRLRSVEKEVNKRFMEGLASNELESTGLLVRKFDTAGINKFRSKKLDQVTFQVAPITMDFLEERGAAVWLPSTSEKMETVSDRFSASIINKKAPWTIDGGGIGIVMDPDLSRKTILCAYADDGLTYDWTVDCLKHPTWDPCIPGCFSAKRRWCQPHDHWSKNCPWRPTQLKMMMQTQAKHNAQGTNWDGHAAADGAACVGNTMPGRCYNEVVQSAKMFEARLPGIVQAFFVQAETVGCGSPLGCPGVAEAIRQAFVRRYNLSGWEQPPLLRFDALAQNDEHFRLIDDSVAGALRLSALGNFVRRADTFGLMG